MIVDEKVNREKIWINIIIKKNNLIESNYFIIFLIIFKILNAKIPLKLRVVLLLGHPSCVVTFVYNSIFYLNKRVEKKFLLIYIFWYIWSWAWLLSSLELLFTDRAFEENNDLSLVIRSCNQNWQVPWSFEHG